MTYVDAIRVWPTKIRCFQGGSCHLFADTIAELHAFAQSLGMRPEWFQNKPSLPHYDLTPKRRERAIALGAKPLAGRELLFKWRQIREDIIRPGEYAVEHLWKRSDGLDMNGHMWLTPRMLRNAKRLEEWWEHEHRPAKA